MGTLAGLGLFAAVAAMFFVRFVLAGRRDARRAAEARAEKERKFLEPAAGEKRKRSGRESAAAAIAKDPARAAKALRKMIGGMNRD